ncbi:MAG TPA: hypothetical protein VN750_13640 [Steroidobacteraceae bacterium]|nr:hypothetical protein [Steroidobacteraceae bacterium]
MPASRKHRTVPTAALGILLTLVPAIVPAADDRNTTGLPTYPHIMQFRQASIERDIALRDAAREEAVRYHLTRMFRTAIADQGQGTQPATAKSMIDSSALRVLREYRDRPQLAGQLVLTLADLYGALEDVAGAGSLLEGFVSQAGPDADPLALADARQKLANIELLRGHADRAAVLLDQAQDFWR